MASSRIFFVVGCARSGTTSLAQMLDTARNARCLVEPLPNLNVETREMMEGRLPNPRQVLAEQVLPRVARCLDEGEVYGEKNVTLGPFLPHLHELLRCRFVFIKRDGRDVVTSLMNWHNEGFGSIYRECREPSELSEVARAAVARLPPDQDTSDYSRPRPGPGDPFHDEWPSLTRFEMMSWYWAFINRLYLRSLAEIPSQDQITIDYTHVGADDVRRVFDFLELEGFDEARVREMIDARINSVWDRFKIRARFPSWRDWTPGQASRFERIASEAMDLLGYRT